MEDKPRFFCNECEVEVSVEDIPCIVMMMESCEATCPHCGRVNEISGFSEVFAFVCRLMQRRCCFVNHSNSF
jgi:hypothetical protein